MMDTRATQRSNILDLLITRKRRSTATRVSNMNEQTFNPKKPIRCSIPGLVSQVETIRDRTQLEIEQIILQQLRLHPTVLAGYRNIVRDAAQFLDEHARECSECLEQSKLRSEDSRGNH